MTHETTATSGRAASEQTCSRAWRSGATRSSARREDARLSLVSGRRLLLKDGMEAARPMLLQKVSTLKADARPRGRICIVVVVLFGCKKLKDTTFVENNLEPASVKVLGVNLSRVGVQHLHLFGRIGLLEGAIRNPELDTVASVLTGFNPEILGRLGRDVWLARVLGRRLRGEISSDLGENKIENFELRQ